jgi:hypothetical protein
MEGTVSAGASLAVSLGRASGAPVASARTGSSTFASADHRAGSHTKAATVKFGSKARRTRAAINARGLPTSLFNNRVGGAGPSARLSGGCGPDRTRGAERVAIRGVPNDTSLVVGLGTRCVVALLGKSHSPRLQDY